MRARRTRPMLTGAPGSSPDRSGAARTIRDTRLPLAIADGRRRECRTQSSATRRDGVRCASKPRRAPKLTSADASAGPQRSGAGSVDLSRSVNAGDIYLSRTK